MNITLDIKNKKQQPFLVKFSSWDLDVFPSIEGGYEILEVHGLEQEIAALESRHVTLKIAFNSDKPQGIGFRFAIDGSSPNDLFSKTTSGVISNDPKILAEDDGWKKKQNKS